MFRLNLHRHLVVTDAKPWRVMRGRGLIRALAMHSKLSMPAIYAPTHCRSCCKVYHNQRMLGGGILNNCPNCIVVPLGQCNPYNYPLFANVEADSNKLDTQNEHLLARCMAVEEEDIKQRLARLEEFFKQI